MINNPPPTLNKKTTPGQRSSPLEHNWGASLYRVIAPPGLAIPSVPLSALSPHDGKWALGLYQTLVLWSGSRIAGSVGGPRVGGRWASEDITHMLDAIWPDINFARANELCFPSLFLQLCLLCLILSFILTLWCGRAGRTFHLFNPPCYEESCRGNTLLPECVCVVQLQNNHT